MWYHVKNVTQNSTREEKLEKKSISIWHQTQSLCDRSDPLDLRRCRNIFNQYVFMGKKMSQRGGDAGTDLISIMCLWGKVTQNSTREEKQEHI